MRSSAIPRFFGSLDRYKPAKGLFATTASFTREAWEKAGMPEWTTAIPFNLKPVFCPAIGHRQ